jgi:hypothetical protein
LPCALQTSAPVVARALQVPSKPPAKTSPCATAGVVYPTADLRRPEQPPVPRRGDDRRSARRDAAARRRSRRSRRSSRSGRRPGGCTSTRASHPCSCPGRRSSPRRSRRRRGARIRTGSS